jgi:hypothetical protein
MVIKEPRVEVTEVRIGVNSYFTISEDNFGSVHHATFSRDELRKALAKIDHGNDEHPDPKLRTVVLACEVKHGQVWLDSPFKGLAQIWEVRVNGDKRRCVSLTYFQVGELLSYFNKA